MVNIMGIIMITIMRNIMGIIMVTMAVTAEEIVSLDRGMMT